MPTTKDKPPRDKTAAMPKPRARKSAKRAQPATPRKRSTTVTVLRALGADVPDEATLAALRESFHRDPLPWTEPQLHALDRIFEGRKTQAEVAKVCGTSPRTLAYWIAHPDFQAALAAKRKALIESLDHVPYIRKERRLIALAQMAEDARAAYEEKRFLVERRPTGRDPETGELLMLEQETYNRDAFESFRGALDDIAKELGARKQVAELGGTVNVRQQVTFYMPQPETAPPDVVTGPVTVDALPASGPASGPALAEAATTAATRVPFGVPFGLTIEAAPEE